MGHRRGLRLALPVTGLIGQVEKPRLEDADFYYHIYMRYNIVAGEELKKILTGVIDNPIPFNEDMSIGSYINEPFSESFIKERSQVHNATASLYKEKLSSFLSMINNLTKEDEIHLYFGDDATCLANRMFLIDFLRGKASKITLHIVDEYSGKEIDVQSVCE